jgi:methionine synthase I (cobalamin-dependent)/5,10-methylenetetrahydrofolate reductase
MPDKYSFLEDLKSSRQPFIADGAMGTMLHQRGQGFQHCFDLLNLTQPSLVAEIHHAYIDAGAQIIQTNTFGANRFKLSRHDLDSRLEEINVAGVELARRVVMASFKKVYIAGDIGPLGVRLAPFGRVQLEEAREVFCEQISALVGATVDLLIIETMTDLFEIREAVLAAREVDARIPILASMTFTRDDRTLLGDSPEKVAEKINDAGADLIGVNCSGGPDQILRVLKAMRQAVPEGLFSAMPNAGWPEQVSGRIFYPATPEYFGEYALSFWQAGARVIGGCCGTTPQHITFMRKSVDSTPVETLSVQPAALSRENEEIPETRELPTLLAQKLAAGNFIFAVEMDPPRGLATQKLLAGASLLAESGADVIDVADSPMARMRMSPWAVCSLIQKSVGVETVLHFPTRGRNLLRVQGDLLAAHAIGVRNIFVIMGDPTAIGDYPNAADNFDLVPSGLIRLIKEGFNTGVDHSGSDIGQPTSFFAGCALNLNPSNPEQEARNLHRKVAAGADFILTQPVFEPTKAVSFMELYDNEFEPLKVPVLLGILPLNNLRHANFLHQEVPGVDIPLAILQNMESAGDNGINVGAEIASELIREMRPHIQGVYLMPAFNRFDIVAGIIEQNK